MGVESRCFVIEDQQRNADSQTHIYMLSKLWSNKEIPEEKIFLTQFAKVSDIL